MDDKVNEDGMTTFIKSALETKLRAYYFRNGKQFFSARQRVSAPGRIMFPARPGSCFYYYNYIRKVEHPTMLTVIVVTHKHLDFWGFFFAFGGTFIEVVSPLAGWLGAAGSLGRMWA